MSNIEPIEQQRSPASGTISKFYGCASLSFKLQVFVVVCMLCRVNVKRNSSFVMFDNFWIPPYVVRPQELYRPVQSLLRSWVWISVTVVPFVDFYLFCWLWSRVSCVFIPCTFFEWHHSVLSIRFCIWDCHSFYTHSHLESRWSQKSSWRFLKLSLDSPGLQSFWSLLDHPAAFWNFKFQINSAISAWRSKSSSTFCFRH